MAPSITYIDIATGDRLEQVSLKPELHQLSIRHMAEDARGRIWFGGQFEGGARPVSRSPAGMSAAATSTLCEAPMRSGSR